MEVVEESREDELGRLELLRSSVAFRRGFHQKVGMPPSPTLLRDEARLAVLEAEIASWI